MKIIKTQYTNDQYESSEQMYNFYKQKTAIEDMRGKWLLTIFTPNTSKGVKVEDLYSFRLVSSKSESFLYDRNFNPICITIIENPLDNEKDKTKQTYNIITTLKSIDDACYQISLENQKYNRCNLLRRLLAIYIDMIEDENKGIDGDQLLEFCVRLGFNKKTINYN